ncbi:carbohydrate ABC transporter permease [Halarsenatibacter silvermanii]|uniref:Carbohydrate ABC transporter membrane protein 1, CUT1 family n=1 Tax=Halarsenatibacter silvermanii TaxID=321763 RepID=A0A1G9TBM6_9FIRM|nr:sugar ABC transporter permease [Halarsenatibacter silvermanii]SDM45111.1 carbohydrate ABC transporter membrane protein 1, CUT1 family [Halarsenatibacter silvermanii]
MFEDYNIKKVKFAYKLILPGLLWIALMLGIPLAYAFYQSFFEVSALLPEDTFIGLENYITAFKDTVVQQSFLRTIVFVFFTLTLSFATGMISALLLNRKITGKKLFRACLLIPFMVSGVAVGVSWQWIFTSDLGVLNNFLRFLGISPVSWLAQPNMAMFSVIVANTWRFYPFAFIILLAGMQQIEDMYYESAKIDGANRWQRFVHITLPMLKPQINITLIYLSFACFNQFDTIYSLTGGGPGEATEVLALNMYRTAFSRFDWGYGSALAILLFLMNAVLSLVYNKFLESEERA